MKYIMDTNIHTVNYFQIPLITFIHAFTQYNEEEEMIWLKSIEYSKLDSNLFSWG